MRTPKTKVINTSEHLPLGASFPATLTLKCGPKAVTVLTDSEKDNLIADHVIGIASFTARFIVNGNNECHRVGIVLAMDEHGQSTGTIMTPEMVNAAIGEFITMIHKMVGSEIMMEAVTLRRAAMGLDDLVDDAMSDIGLGCANDN